MSSILDLANAAMSLQDDYRMWLEQYWNESYGPVSWKLQEFTRFVPRQALARFLVRDRLFQMVLDVQGSVLECGVFGGWGLMAWAQLSAIYEPLNHQRHIIGFDTFDGFAGLSGEDACVGNLLAVRGGLAIDSYEDILRCIKLYNMNRFLQGLPKVELVRGDICITAEEYLRNNPSLVVSLMYLDMDVYEPTLAALKAFLPRMPKGAVLAFDQLNCAAWPGETTAVLRAIGIDTLALRRFNFDTKICYAVLEG